MESNKNDLQDLAGIVSNIDFAEEAHFVGMAEPLIAHLGLGIESREPHESYMWDGKCFNSELPDRHILHDIAHWPVAVPERRALPEFGLSGGPETCLDFGVEELIPSHAEKHEEVCASLLGILIQHELGMPCGLIAEEVSLGRDGNIDAFRRDWLEAYCSLINEGLINSVGVPSVILDMRERSVSPRM